MNVIVSHKTYQFIYLNLIYSLISTILTKSTNVLARCANSNLASQLGITQYFIIYVHSSHLYVKYTNK